jgi:hypothetical protein
VTASASETSQRGLRAAGITVAANIVLLILGLTAGPGPFLLGQALLGLATVVTSMVQYRRGWRYTGLGLLGGWLGGLLVAIAILATA